MTPNVILAHLYALRVQIDAIIATAEAEAGISHGVAREPGSCPQCGAPPDKVEDRSTLDGTRRDWCSRCGAEWERFAAV